MSSKELNLEEAVREVYYWQYSNTDCFTNKLFDLMQKADGNNRLRICAGFPAEYMAWCLWSNAGDNGDDLFREYGLMKKKEGQND